MKEFIPVIFVAVFVLIVLVSVFYNKKAIIKRKLKKAPLKRISSFKDGELAKLVGKVEFVEEALKAPLSGRECAYYHIRVEQQVSSGKSSHWKTIVDEVVANKFVIREGNEAAFVHSTKVKSHVVEDRKYRSGFLNDASEKLEAYLNRHGLESENFLGLNKTIRYREGILEKGEKIAVLGTGKWTDASQLDLPDYYGRVLYMSSRDDQQVYLSDDPETLGALV
ncbi:hypothetical protein [Carboxylicivirga sp. N1Y90]|uniref:hypothetical protein n=1 Tax=Carboxylicivirga fragile TaxID=3417571 RepID=UPI003D343E2D|nr:hypothetical protein [Marinilabiliaceae bacterium N1Y90]